MELTYKQPSSLDEVFEVISSQDIKYVRMEICDVNCVARSKVVPVKHFKSYCSKGVAFSTDMYLFGINGNVAEDSPLVKKFGFSDTLCFPVVGTFIVLPWLPGVARILVNPKLMLGRNPVEFSPYSVAENQLKILRDMGFTLLTAFEYEFYLQNSLTKEMLTDHKSMCLSSLLVGRYHELFDAIVKGLTAVGIDVEAVVSENSPSQFEINFKPKFGIDAAMDGVTFRTSMKEICSQNGITVSFMTKPWQDKDGCSAHLNHSLWDENQNISLMHDIHNPTKLSAVASYWIAGLVKHAPALFMLSAGNSNCLLRPKSAGFAPSCVTWGFDSRISSIRVKSLPDRVSYVEQRMPSSACNPLIALAATIAAGVDGIRRKLELPVPTATEAIRLSDAARKCLVPLPSTLEEGLEALQADEAMCEALGSEFIGNFVVVKKDEGAIRDKALSNGWDEFEWGRAHYFDFI